MITLNLLPPLKKQELRLRGLYVAIKNMMFTVLLLTICSAIILLISKAVLQNHFNQTVADSTLTIKFGQTFNNDIRVFNRQLNAVTAIQRDYVYWSEFFAAFAPVVPPGVTLSNLTVVDENGLKTITITGLAKTREQLLAFQTGLEQFEFISGVAVPLESLLKKEDIIFTIKATVNPAALDGGL